MYLVFIFMSFLYRYLISSSCCKDDISTITSKYYMYIILKGAIPTSAMALVNFLVSKSQKVSKIIHRNKRFMLDEIV